MVDKKKFWNYEIDTDTLTQLNNRISFEPIFTEPGHKMYGGFMKSNVNATADTVMRIERLAIAVFQENLKLEKRISELEKNIQK